MLALVGCDLGGLTGGSMDAASDARVVHEAGRPRADAHGTDAPKPDSHTADSHTADSHTADSHTADSHTIDSRTVDAPTDAPKTDARTADAHGADAHATDAHATDARAGDAHAEAGPATEMVRQSARMHSTTGSSVVGVFMDAPLTGSVLCATLFANTPLSVTSVTGGGVTTWSAGPSSAPSLAAMVTYWGVVDGAPGDDITANFSGALEYAEIFMVEIAGATSVDISHTTSGNGATVPVPTLTLAGAGEVVVAQTWLQGGAVTAVNDEGFVDSYDPVGFGPGIFQSFDVLGSAASYLPETYMVPSGLWFSQAIAFRNGT